MQLYKSAFSSIDSLPARLATYIIQMYGRSLRALGRDKDALQAYKRIDDKAAYRTTPSWNMVKFNEAHITSGYSFTKALTLYDRIIATAPEESDRQKALFMKARTCLSNDRLNLAEKYFNEFLTKHGKELPKGTRYANQYLAVIAQMRSDQLKDKETQE